MSRVKRGGGNIRNIGEVLAAKTPEYLGGPAESLVSSLPAAPGPPCLGKRLSLCPAVPFTLHFPSTMRAKEAPLRYDDASGS